MEIEIIRYNIKSMLSLRGDDISYIEEHGDAVESSKYYDKLITLNTDKTTVFFALSKDILNELKNTEFKTNTLEELIKKHKTDTFILVLNETPSANFYEFIEKYQKDKAAIQIFFTKELLFDPSKHELVDKHEKLPEKEAKEMMDQYMVTKNKLPWISRNDIMARWLGLRVNDIVRITRNNESCGEYYYYRVCI